MNERMACCSNVTSARQPSGARKRRSGLRALARPSARSRGERIHSRAAAAAAAAFASGCLGLRAAARLSLRLADRPTAHMYEYGPASGLRSLSAVAGVPAAREAVRKGARG